MLAKTRQTWKLDGMNTAEFEIISRQHLPLYTNITVNIGTEAGLHPLPQTPPPPPPPKDRGKSANSQSNVPTETAAKEKQQE